LQFGQSRPLFVQNSANEKDLPAKRTGEGCVTALPISI
jgi:hypothetical protein